MALLGFALVVTATVALAGAARVESERGPTLETMLVHGNGQSVCDEGDGIVRCRGYMPTSAHCGEATTKGGQTFYLCRVVYPRGGPSRGSSARRSTSRGIQSGRATGRSRPSSKSASRLIAPRTADDDHVGAATRSGVIRNTRANQRRRSGS